MNPAGASISATDLARSFRETGPVLTPLNFKIESGDFVSLLGPSGCGKSTLLRLIADLDQPDAGDLKVESTRTESFRSFVFQEAQLLPWRNVLENVALPLELMKVSRPERLEKARDVLNRVGLGKDLERFPNQLSGGMKMRVSVARALVTRPSLLLLDEPFAALDENTRFYLQEQLRELWEETKMTVVFVTHSASEAVFLSERALVFSARPARILLDHRVELGSKRTSALRNAPEFIREIQQVAARSQR